MKIYNYQFLNPYTNGTICITVRNGDGERVADAIALDELASALSVNADDWYIEDCEVEDF